MVPETPAVSVPAYMTSSPGVWVVPVKYSVGIPWLGYVIRQKGWYWCPNYYVLSKWVVNWLEGKRERSSPAGLGEIKHPCCDVPSEGHWQGQWVAFRSGEKPPALTASEKKRITPPPVRASELLLTSEVEKGPWASDEMTASATLWFLPSEALTREPIYWRLWENWMCLVWSHRSVTIGNEYATDLDS